MKAETGRNCNDGADNIVGESTPSTVSDDFSGPKKNAPDSYLWGYDTGADWPNAELQTYTKSVNNASTDGEGHLVITALKTSVGYSSARLKTQGNLDMGYGRVEASIQMPPGPNVLPAFWLLDSNYPSVGGAACGEIDIIEYVQGACHFTLHGPQQGEEDLSSSRKARIFRSVSRLDAAVRSFPELSHLLGGSVPWRDHRRC